MNAAQIHLALNHAPLFLALTGGLVLFYSLFTKNDSTRRIAYYMLVAGALLTIPVYLTGEGTEELVEELPGVSEGIIEKHETMAKLSLIIILLTGVAALVSLFAEKKAGLAKTALIVTGLLSMASFGTMAQTAHLGGQIRHSEIRTGAVIPGEGKEKEDDDEKKEERTTEKKIIPDSIATQAPVADTVTRKKEKDKDDDD